MKRPLRALRLAAPAAAAQTEPAWPAQPVPLIVASAASGAPGVEAAARAPADGHTLLPAHLGLLVIHGLLRPAEVIDTLAASAPISRAVEVPSVLVVPATRP